MYGKIIDHIQHKEKEMRFERDHDYEDFDEALDLRNQRGKDELQLETFIKHLDGAGVSHTSLYHYTRWEALEKMMADVSGGPARGRKMLLLTKASKTNDKVEKGWGDNVFLACFSYSRYEDVAMWANYGKRLPDAVRIRFDGRVVKDWYERHKHGEGLFSVTEKDGKFRFAAIDPVSVESVKLVDVAYVIPSKMMGRRMWGNVEYSRRFYHVIDSDDSIKWSDSVYEGCQDKNLRPYFKKRGWAYERETRLVVTLKEASPDVDRIGISFTEPFRRFGEELRDPGFRTRAVISGPWYGLGDIPKTKILGIGLSDVGKSDYVSEINLLDKCANCALTTQVKNELQTTSPKGEVRVFACADIHRCNLDDLNPAGADIAIIAGDMQGSGSYPGADPSDSWIMQQVEWVNDKLIPWCNRHKGTQFVIVAGNCDEFALTSKSPLRNLSKGSNIHYLQDSMIEIKGIKIWGTPWVMRKAHRVGKGKMFEKTSEELRAAFSKIPKGIDILVSHSTPKVDGTYIAGDPEKNFGNSELTEAILEKEPKYCLCGHIHAKEHHAVILGKTVVRNASLIRHSREDAEFPPCVFRDKKEGCPRHFFRNRELGVP